MLLDLYVKVIVPPLTNALPIWGCATNMNEFNVRNLYIAEPLSSAEVPKNSNTSCPPPPPPRAFFFFLPASLRHKEAPAEEREA